MVEQKTPINDLSMLFTSEFSDELLKNCLNQGKIKASEKPENPPQILWVGDCVFATFGNFSASTGKAKSKKTFNISAIVAAALKNGCVLNYRASLPEGKRKIFYFDTEQSRFHCHNVLERILKLAGLPEGSDSDLITFVGLREYTPSLRLSLIDYALRTSKGYGLVIIDGIRDLMYDINNAKESTDVMTMLMNNEEQDVKNILVLQNWLERIRKEVTIKVLIIKRISEYLNFPILAQPTLKKI